MTLEDLLATGATLIAFGEPTARKVSPQRLSTLTIINDSPIVPSCMHQSYSSSEDYINLIMQLLIDTKKAILSQTLMPTLLYQPFLCEQCVLLLLLKSNYLHSFNYVFEMFASKNAKTLSEFMLIYSISIIIESILLYPCIMSKFLSQQTLASTLFAWLQFLQIFWGNAHHYFLHRQDFENWNCRNGIDLVRTNSYLLSAVCLLRMNINIMNWYIKYGYFDHWMDVRLFIFKNYIFSLADTATGEYLFRKNDIGDKLIRLFVRFYLKNLSHLKLTKKMKKELNYFRIVNVYLEKHQKQILKQDRQYIKKHCKIYSNQKRCGNVICNKSRKNKYYKCSGCELIYFCSKKCQKYAWTRLRHRNVCRKLKLRSKFLTLQKCPNIEMIVLHTADLSKYKFK
eukprot:315321_1